MKNKVFRVDMDIIQDMQLYRVVIWRRGNRPKIHFVSIFQFKHIFAWLNDRYEARVNTNDFWNAFSVTFVPKREAPERDLVMERTAVELATETIRMQKELIASQDKTINTLYAVRASYEKALTDIYQLLPSIKDSSWITGVDQIEEIVEDALRLGKSE